MKAVVYTEYGSPDVLQLKEVEKPTPKDNEVLIRVHATPVNFGDIIARNLGKISPREFNMPSLFWLFARMEFGFRKPRKNILGSELAGEIERSRVRRRLAHQLVERNVNVVQGRPGIRVRVVVRVRSAGHARARRWARRRIVEVRIDGCHAGIDVDPQILFRIADQSQSVDRWIEVDAK